MWKLKTPVPYGNDQLSLIAPIRFEGDLGANRITITPGFAVREKGGLCLGSIEDVEGGQEVVRLPPLDVQFTITEFPGAISELLEIRADLEQVLDRYMRWAYENRGQLQLNSRTFRVGRTQYPIEIEWADHDPTQDFTFMEHKPRPMPAEPPGEREGRT